MKFEELNLHTETLQALNNNQHEGNSFQKAILDAVKSERNLVMRTDEGEDEGLAFAIAAIETVKQSEEEKGTKALILSNDSESLNRFKNQILSLDADIDCMLIGTEGDEEAQAESIAQGHSIVLAQPARLHSVIKKNRYIFRQLKLLVLDHFDKMISKGQKDALNSIKKRILSDCSTVVSTGVYEKDVKKAALDFAGKPLVKGFGPPPPPAIPGHVKQGYINVPPRMKISTLLSHLKKSDSGNCIIFTDSKRGTDKLYRILKKQRMKAVSLHHKLSEERRAQRFANFANGNVQYLLVSDISAVDLDIKGVAQVINYDVPANPDEYRYRSALTESGGNSKIVSLVSKQDRNDIKQLKNELGQSPEEIPLPESVKKKLNERKNKKGSNGQKGRGQNKAEELELPQPTFDQLSGGRSGSQNDEEKGIVTFFKKLFS